MFLNDDELVKLTGRKMKARQIEALRSMGLPFFINAIGQPVVARSVIEGGKKTEEPKPRWTPNVLKMAR